MRNIVIGDKAKILAAREAQVGGNKMEVAMLGYLTRM